MDKKDLNEIKAAIKYMDYKPLLLSKFYDVKSLLFKEIQEDEEFYKASTVLPNPLNDNKIIKCINILDAKYTKNKEHYDCVRTPVGLPEKAVEILKTMAVTEDGGSVNISVGTEITADIYINIPRGNSMEITNVKLGQDVRFEVMNTFNPYVSEGFIFAIRTEDLSISVEPSSLEGIKGQGDVFVYVMNENAIYKDEADKYFDVSEILKIFRGWF